MPPNTEFSTLTSSDVISQKIEKNHHNNSNNNEEETTKKKKNLKWYQFETPIVPQNFMIMAFLQTMFVYFTITFPYRQYPVLVLWSLFTTYVAIFGVTAGIHRLWSHRTYKATLPVRIVLAMFFYSAGQMKIRQWARQHRIHHKYADTDGDPHNAKRGLFFSHIGWLVLEEKPEVDECRNKIGIDDVLADPVVQFFDNNFAIMQTLFIGAIPSLIPWYFFNQPLMWSVISQVFIKYPLSIHITASVNSFAHAFGYHTYDKNILPTENFLISCLTIGEGWHNYHHAFPWDYRASEFGNFFFNPTTTLLNLLSKVGLIYDLKYASDDHIKKVIDKKGDGNTLSDIYRNIDKVLP